MHLTVRSVGTHGVLLDALYPYFAQAPHKALCTATKTERVTSASAVRLVVIDSRPTKKRKEWTAPH